MHKYIESDIKQGITYLRIAINNALADLESGEEREIDFKEPVPLQLVIQEAEKRGWAEDMEDDWGDWTNGWEVDYWYKMFFPGKDLRLNISGSLVYGHTSISIEKLV